MYDERSIDVEIVIWRNFSGHDWRHQLGQRDPVRLAVARLSSSAGSRLDNCHVVRCLCGIYHLLCVGLLARAMAGQNFVVLGHHVTRQYGHELVYADRTLALTRRPAHHQHMDEKTCLASSPFSH